MLENHPQFSFLIERTGWLLIHSLWQFALWALIAVVLLKCLRRASAATRYSALVGILALMTLTPVVAWWFLPDSTPSLVQSEPEVIEDVSAPVEPRVAPVPLAEPDRFPNLATRIEASASAGAMEPVERVADSDREPTSANEPVRATSWSTVIHQALEPWLTWIVGLWFAGMLVFSLRPLAGWATMRRLSRTGISVVPENILSLLRETAERLGIRKAVSIFQSSLVTVPLVTGFLRPMILLPASVVTGFPPAQLQAILAHELAHIRRYDQFVNLWQMLVETIFFYHPVVWWLSRQIRNERENCCDDLAVSVTGGKAEYGRALLALDELRGKSSALALSSHGGSLSSRIRRLVTGESSSQRVGLLGIVAFLILLGGVAASFLWWNPQEQAAASTEKETEPPMSAEELAAWDALGEIEGLFSHDLIHRQHFKGHLRTLERLSFPEETLNHHRHELERPVRFADFMHVPEQAWPHIVKLKSLRSLSITSTDVRGRPMEWISQMKNLESITIDFGQCVPEDLVHLKHLPNLERIEVAITVLGKSKDDWRRQRGELTEAEQAKLDELLIPKPPANQRLDRELVTVALHTDRAIRELSVLKKLRSLKLRNSFATDASLEALANCPELEELELSILNAPVEAPESIGEISALRSFSQSHADNETLKELSTLSNLEHLDVWADGVTSEGVPHLLKLRNLRTLKIQGSRLDDAGLVQLAQLPRLEYLDVRPCKGTLTLAGVLAFQEKKPDCRIEVDDNLPLGPEDESKPDAEKTEPEVDPEEDEKTIPILERKVSLKTWKVPLRETLRIVGERAHVEIKLDQPALEKAKLDLEQPLTVSFENLTLQAALGELIDWHAHPGLFREVRGGKLILTTIAAREKQVQQHLPEWLKPFFRNGMSVRLDDNNEVKELYFGDPITDDLLAKLKTLPALRMLNIGVTTQLTPAGLAHLGELDNLHRLEVYTVNKDKGLGDDILNSIVGLKNLRELSIDRCGVTDEGLKHLEQMPQLTSLRLNVEGLLTDDCLSSIAKLENLQMLSMSNDGSTAPFGWMEFSAEALAQLSALQNLEELHLAGQPFPGDSFTFTKLKALSVSGNQVHDKFVQKLKQCPDLRTLHLWRTQVTDYGLKQIAELPELRDLSLNYDPVSDEGLRALQNSPHLERIGLRDLNITDTGIGYLAQIDTLTRIDLHACNETSVFGLQQLLLLPRLRTLYLTGFRDQTDYRELNKLVHLRELSFTMCGISQEDLTWLKQAMPRTQIYGAAVPLEEEESIIPRRPRDPADIDAPLPLQVSRKNPPDWVVPCHGDTTWSIQIPVFLPDNALLVVGADGTQLEVRNPKDGKTINSFSDVGYKFHQLRISHDRRRVVYIKRPRMIAGVNNVNPWSATIEVRELPSFELVGKPIKTEMSWGQSPAISSAGKFIAFNTMKNPNGVSIWDVETGKQLKETPIVHDSVHSLAFSPDGRWLVNSSLGDLSFWEWKTEKPPQTIHVGRHTWSLAFTPDSRYLFEGYDSRRDIQVRDLKTMKVVRRFKDDTGHSMSVNNLQFTDGGKTLVAGNAIGFNWQKLIVNDRLHFWDIETGKILRKFDFTRHEVYSVAVSPNGRYLVAILDDLDEALIAGWDLTKLDSGSP